MGLTVKFWVVQGLVVQGCSKRSCCGECSWVDMPGHALIHPSTRSEQSALH